MAIKVVDYGCGNLISVASAFNSVTDNVSLTTDPTHIFPEDLLVLPGVGAFGAAMSSLNKTGFNTKILEHVNSGGKLIGICLGMQILFTEGYEFGCNKGLGIIGGSVELLPAGNNKVPHIGWKQVTSTSQSTLSHDGKAFYFVHSYQCLPENKDITCLTTSGNEGDVVAMIRQGNVIGMQFHPEKSAENGLKLLSEVVRL